MKIWNCILNILTFGAHSKLLKTTDKYNKTLANKLYEYEEKMKRADELIKKAEGQQKTYITTEAFQNNGNYLQFFANIQKEPRWNFFLTELKNEILGELVTESLEEKNALRYQALLKGLELINIRILAKVKEYNSLKEKNFAEI